MPAARGPLVSPIPTEDCSPQQRWRVAACNYVVIFCDQNVVFSVCWGFRGGV